MGGGGEGGWEVHKDNQLNNRRVNEDDDAVNEFNEYLREMDCVTSWVTTAWGVGRVAGGGELVDRSLRRRLLAGVATPPSGFIISTYCSVLFR